MGRRRCAMQRCPARTDLGPHQQWMPCQPFERRCRACRPPSCLPRGVARPGRRCMRRSSSAARPEPYLRRRRRVGRRRRPLRRLAQPSGPAPALDPDGRRPGVVRRRRPALELVRADRRGAVPVVCRRPVPRRLPVHRRRAVPADPSPPRRRRSRRHPRRGDPDHRRGRAVVDVPHAAASSPIPSSTACPSRSASPTRSRTCS